MQYILSLFIVFSLILVPVDAYAKRVCVKPDGTLITRKKCKAAKGLSDASLGLFSQSIEGQPGPVGPAGPQGATGPAGPMGDPGIDGVTGYEVLDDQSNNFTFGTTLPVFESVSCPSGKQALGGGCFMNSLDVTLVSSGPTNLSGQGWACVFRNDSGSNISNAQVTARVICGTVNN